MQKLNKIFFHFIMAYVILILIPLITGTILNYRIVDEYENHVIESHLNSLIKTESILEGFIDDIKWSTYQLAKDTKLTKLLENSSDLSEEERTTIISELGNELKNSILYNTSNNSTFYIYFNDMDLIITPFSTYTRWDFGNSISYFNMQGTTSVGWHTLITERKIYGEFFPPRITIIEDFKNKNMIPYVQTIPIDSTKPSKGVIVYLIGESDFTQFIDKRSIPDGGFTYIADSNNSVVAKSSKFSGEISPLDLDDSEGILRTTIDGKKMFVIYTTSKRNNWTYVSVLPEEWVLQNVNFYQILSLIVMAIALFICLGVAYTLSKQWSNPLIKSINSLSDYLNIGKKEQSFSNLNRHVDQLIEKTVEITDELSHQKVFVDNAFVNRLVHGFFRNAESMENYLSHTGFSITEERFNVVIFSLRDFEFLGTAESFYEVNNIKKDLITVLQQKLHIRMIVSEQDDSDIVIIFMTNNRLNHMDIITTSLEYFVKELSAIYRSNLIISVGKTVNTLMDIHKSYIQSQDIINHVEKTEDKLIYTQDDVDKTLDSYYYPIELESRLITTVKAGNEDNCKKVFEILESENFSSRNLDKSNIEAFYENMLNTYRRVYNQLAEKQKIEVTKKYDSITKFDIKSIQDLFREMCIVQNSNKKSHNNLLSDNVRDFLNKNYSDKNLSLNSVAEHFSLTESYLSFFFKEQTGINFSTFLERIRMEKAKELLRITDNTIHRVADMVGYNSDKTFRRVFQKNMTISPSKYRIQSRAND